MAAASSAVPDRRPGGELAPLCPLRIKRVLCSIAGRFVASRHRRSRRPPGCLRACRMPGHSRKADSVASGVQVGDKAPDFTLVSQSGEQVRLSDRLADRVVVLYFYPKDETRGCTAEACAFRDSHEVFAEAGAEVIGVSSDSAGKHAAFAGPSQAAVHLAERRGRPGSQELRGADGAWPDPRPGHLRDRPVRHRQARLQLDDQHRPARRRRAHGGAATPGGVYRLNTRVHPAAIRSGAMGRHC